VVKWARFLIGANIAILDFLLCISRAVGKNTTVHRFSSRSRDNMSEIRPIYFTILIAVFSWLPTSASATFIGDSVDATVNSTFGTPISGTAVIGAGADFKEVGPSHAYSLDLSASSFTLTVSKPITAGNFTGVLKSLILGNLDFDVTSVIFNAGVSSLYSGGLAIDFSTPGQIAMATTSFISINSPASALSHSLTWDVTFGDRLSAVPEPTTLVLIGLGLAGLGFRKKRQT